MNEYLSLTLPLTVIKLKELQLSETKTAVVIMTVNRTFVISVLWIQLKKLFIQHLGAT